MTDPREPQPHIPTLAEKVEEFEQRLQALEVSRESLTTQTTLPLVFCPTCRKVYVMSALAMECTCGAIIRRASRTALGPEPKQNGGT